MRKILIAVAASLALTPAMAQAQKAVAEGEVLEMTATIEAIDKDLRLVTLKDKDGVLDTVYAGPRSSASTS